jgi:hypothetical protein
MPQHVLHEQQKVAGLEDGALGIRGKVEENVPFSSINLRRVGRRRDRGARR